MRNINKFFILSKKRDIRFYSIKEEIINDEYFYHYHMIIFNDIKINKISFDKDFKIFSIFYNDKLIERFNIIEKEKIDMNYDLMNIERFSEIINIKFDKNKINSNLNIIKRLSKKDMKSLYESNKFMKEDYHIRKIKDEYFRFFQEIFIIDNEFHHIYIQSKIEEINDLEYLESILDFYYSNRFISILKYKDKFFKIELDDKKSKNSKYREFNLREFKSIK